MKIITQIKDSSHDWILLVIKKDSVHSIVDETMFALIVSRRDRKLHPPIEGMNWRNDGDSFQHQACRNKTVSYYTININKVPVPHCIMELENKAHQLQICFCNRMYYVYCWESKVPTRQRRGARCSSPPNHRRLHLEAKAFGVLYYDYRDNT